MSSSVIAVCIKESVVEMMISRDGRTFYGCRMSLAIVGLAEEFDIFVRTPKGDFLNIREMGLLGWFTNFLGEGCDEFHFRCEEDVAKRLIEVFSVYWEDVQRSVRWIPN